MKRKVIQIADSTQLISLPRKWSLAHGIKKGDELEITEKGRQLTVSITQMGEQDSLKTNLDLTKMPKLKNCQKN